MCTRCHSRSAEILDDYPAVPDNPARPEKYGEAIDARFVAPRNSRRGSRFRSASTSRASASDISLAISLAQIHLREAAAMLPYPVIADDLSSLWPDSRRSIHKQMMKSRSSSTRCAGSLA